MNVIPKGSVRHQAGSYYLPEFYKEGKNRLFKYYKINPTTQPNSGGLLAVASGLDLQDSRYETVTAKLDALNRTSALIEGHLIGSDGLLLGDVVYCYPSDILFGFAFIDQMRKIMKPGSLLVLPKENSQVAEAIKTYQMEGFTPQPTINKMLVFKKEI